jgi:hypothetical protein
MLKCPGSVQDPSPPDDPYVQVKVLRDYGEVVFTSGKVRGYRAGLPDKVAPCAGPALTSAPLHCAEVIALAVAAFGCQLRPPWLSTMR